MSTLLKPPSHLSAAMKKWFVSVIEEYVLSDSDVRILILAAEAWDRCQQARKILSETGVTYTNRFGDPVSRPEVAIERDSRIAYARLVRELCLAPEEPEPPRPPKPGGKR